MDYIKKAVLTEKTNKLIDKGIYTFKVESKANKIELKKEIERTFSVNVKKINTLNYKGKMKRKMYAKGKFGVGIKNRYKKAIVTLQEGEEIDIYTYGT